MPLDSMSEIRLTLSRCPTPGVVQTRDHARELISWTWKVSISHPPMHFLRSQRIDRWLRIRDQHDATLDGNIIPEAAILSTEPNSGAAILWHTAALLRCFPPSGNAALVCRQRQGADSPSYSSLLPPSCLSGPSPSPCSSVSSLLGWGLPRWRLSLRPCDRRRTSQTGHLGRSSFRSWAPAWTAARQTCRS